VFKPSVELTTTLSAVPAAKSLEPLWRELEQRADASFFQSWHWVGTWLDCLHAGVGAELLRVERAGTVIGLGILVRRTVRRHGFLRSRGLFLNCTGDPLLDEITIEHNGFLAERGAERDVAQSCVTFLLGHRADWDEIFLEGMRDPGLVDGLSLERARLRTLDLRPCPYVDLKALRESGREYVATLGRNTRYNIRRSLREYEKRGTLGLEEATDLARAREHLQRLRELHQRYWEQKGEPGSFANAFFAKFHERLLERALSSGALQLLRITAGKAELGYLYNYVYCGRVYNYQSGFDYAGGGLHERPGLVCHVLAIEHNLRKGYSVYDFMAGDSDYKRNLSTASQTLGWQVIQRPRLKLRIEGTLRRVRDRMTGREASPSIVAAEFDAEPSKEARAI
jgi:CelD/BcsL family acetyltransferase involved in cellulose biosynthesis